MRPIVILKHGDCRRCDGCGWIDDGDEGVPWSTWLDLPRSATIGIDLGLIKPIVCPDCKGEGSRMVTP